MLFHLLVNLQKKKQLQKKLNKYIKMGQKSNLLTLRKKKHSNFLNLQAKDFIYGDEFLKNLKKLFYIKSCFLVNSSLNILGNKTFLVLSIFFSTNKINMYKKKTYFLKTKKKNKNFTENLLLSKLYKKIVNKLCTNLIFISVKNLNIQQSKPNFLILFSKFRKYHSTLFPRRFNFFIDFLKISILFVESKINIQFYLEILGRVFKILPKRRHNFFLVFIQQLFKFFINDYNIKNSLSLKGVKFMISGRIQAKPRAKFKYFQLGKTPTQSISLDVDFSKQHIYTIYGVFGLKIWTFRS